MIHDPVGAAVMQAVAKHNCKNLFDLNSDRIAHFKERMGVRRLSEDDVLIVLLNVDDPKAAALADVLMPGHDWQPYRDMGEVPIARGLVGRAGIQEMLDTVDPEAGKKLRGIRLGVAVLVMDHDVAEIFDVGPC